MLKVAYWKDKKNFGDMLTPFLLDKLLDIKSEWSDLEEADFIGVGSYLDVIPSFYRGFIWGTGKMFPHTAINFTEAKVLAIRGYLSAKQMGIHDIPLGDPGLLCHLFADPYAKKKYKTGVIDHWNDDTLKKLQFGHDIKITWGIQRIINEVNQCDRIISSSLHGLILADSLGLPRMWYRTDKNPGGDFKFQDYQSIYGNVMVPDQWYTANPEIVEYRSEKLLAVLKSHADILRSL